MTAAYWLIGQRIVEFEQEGKKLAGNGKEIIELLSADLTTRYGRGFSVRNVWQMKAFYLAWPIPRKPPAESEAHKILQTVSAESSLTRIASFFPLPWSAYVRLLAVKNDIARGFYQTEALRGGWSVRQLDRQINSQFYERTVLSRNKAAMLSKGEKPLPEDYVQPEEEIKDPFVLEFLGLKDEYSENDLEEALIHHLETFLLELGHDFCFIGRRKEFRDDFFLDDHDRFSSPTAISYIRASTPYTRHGHLPFFQRVDYTSRATPGPGKSFWKTPHKIQSASQAGSGL